MTACTTCGHEFDGEPEHATCPACGTSHQVFTLQDGTKLIGSVLPVTVVTESNYPDGERETVVSGVQRRSTSRSSAGAQTQEFFGRPSQNEENVVDALHRLRDKLNSETASPDWKERVGGDDISIDGTLTHTDGRVLQCQVTRVERETLPDRGRHGRAQSNHDNEALAERVLVAIESKADTAATGVVLVLDANDAPAYSDDAIVVDQVRASMRERGLVNRWNAVWLIGPTVERTIRIDPT